MGRGRSWLIALAITNLKCSDSGACFLKKWREKNFVLARDFFHFRAKRKKFTRHVFRIGKPKRNQPKITVTQKPCRAFPPNELPASAHDESRGEELPDKQGKRCNLILQPFGYLRGNASKADRTVPAPQIGWDSIEEKGLFSRGKT
ncbi:hypothetical protein HR17_02905 [Porphyromonas gulae]|nr:hypothetical protein HR17_02905 [Porphyromonas gulae]KGO04353.1 hypothetical protein HR16_05995 [Porphyromonas gulae]